MKVMSNTILQFVKAYPNHKVTWYIGESATCLGCKYINVVIHDLEIGDKKVMTGYYHYKERRQTITLWLDSKRPYKLNDL